MKKIIITVGIIIILAIIAISLYFLFFAAKPAPAGTQTGDTGSLPAAGNQNNPTTENLASSTSSSSANTFGVISTSRTLDYYVSPANVVTAIELDGTIIQITNGQASTINSLQIQNILGASFSYDGLKILVSFGDAANAQTSIFDTVKKIWTPMPSGLIGPVWSPSDYRIAYETNNDNGTESFKTIDASKLKPAPVLMETLHAQGLSVAWPSKNQLVFYAKPSEYAGESATIFNIQKRTLSVIAAETPGLEILWNGATQTAGDPMALAFSTAASGLGGQLQLLDADGNTTQILKFLTLPSKCGFAQQASSTSYLYCGVPRDQNAFSFSHLPDDYNQMSLFTSDDIYRVNLANGTAQSVFTNQQQNLDVSNIKYFNHMLFFVNRYDQRLYAISLSA